MQPLLTIGVPVYNGAQTLPRTLSSLVTHAAGCAVLISDNGSTDGTEAICRSFVAQHSFVTYVRQKTNIGALPNFQFLRNEAQSKYFMWLADDDWLGDDFCQRGVAMLEQQPDMVLATAASAYYNKVTGAFQHATLANGAEDDDPCRRVEMVVENLTDNTEFYGVYRREYASFSVPNIVGSDWIAICDTAFSGKIGVIADCMLHRTNRWDTTDRGPDAARSQGVPVAQGEQPHYAIALTLLFHVILNSPLHRSLSLPRRIRLALQVFRQFQRLKDLFPSTLDFWPDCARFFGKEQTRTDGHALRITLLRQCLAQLQGSLLLPDAELDVLELAWLLKLWREPMSLEEQWEFSSARDLLAREGDRLSAYACHSLFVPAYEQPRFLSMSQIPYKLLDEYLDYITAAPSSSCSEIERRRFEDLCQRLNAGLISKAVMHLPKVQTSTWRTRGVTSGLNLLRTRFGSPAMPPKEGRP